jgi:HlyD family secretion protein
VEVDMPFFSRNARGIRPGSDVRANVAAGPSVVAPKRLKSGRGAAWSIAAIALALTIGIGHYRKAKSASKPSEKTEGVSAPSVVVSAGDIHATVRVSGTVAALHSASLLAPRILGSRSGMNRGGDAGFGGPGGGGLGGADFNLVLLKLAKPGTPVKAGDVVAEFDPQNQLLRLDDYKDTVVQLENSIKGMMASLAALKETHDQSVRTAKANWDKAVLDLESAPVRSEIDVEKFKLAVEEAQATYKQLAYESSLVDESQRAQIRISELNRDQSKIELQRAEANVQRMTIKAPTDGIVVMASIVRNGEFGQIRAGDQINAGQPFMFIVDPASMVLIATVNQVDAEELRLGMKATIQVDAYPDLKVPATLTGIGAMAKGSTFRQSYVSEIPIRIQVDRMDQRLIPDLTGSTEIVLQSDTNAVVVPRAAVFEETGSTFVFLKSAEGWIRKPVSLGLASFTSVAVHSGLDKGDVVALQRPQ